MLNSVIIGTTLTDIVSGSSNMVSVGLYFCNFSVLGDSVTIHAIKSGGSGTDTNTIVKDMEFTGRETLQFPNEKFILSPGDKISASGAYGSRVSATAIFMDL